MNPTDPDIIGRVVNTILDLKHAGVTLKVQNGELEFDGDAAAVTADRIELLRLHRTLVIDLLTPQAAMSPLTDDELRRIAERLEADDRCANASPRPDPLPTLVSDWPAQWRAEFDQRVDCMVTEGGLSRPEAVAKIEPFIRRWAREEAISG